MPRKIDQFWRKRSQMKRKDVSYQLLLDFFQKYFVVHERWDVKDLLSIYVCTKGIYSCGVNCKSQKSFDSRSLTKHKTKQWFKFNKNCVSNYIWLSGCRNNETIIMSCQFSNETSIAILLNKWSTAQWSKSIIRGWQNLPNQEILTNFIEIWTEAVK